jgi:hypothetical protein
MVSSFLTLIMDSKSLVVLPGGAVGAMRDVKSDCFTLMSRVICSSPDTKGFIEREDRH